MLNRPDAASAISAITLACALAAAGAGHAAANLVTNGSFETVGAYDTDVRFNEGRGAIALHAGIPDQASAIAGWTVSQGAVALVESYATGQAGINTWQADDGALSLELSSGGTVTQSFATVAGSRYKLTYAYAANPRGRAGSTALGLNTAQQAESYAFADLPGGQQVIYALNIGITRAHMGWETASAEFTAIGPESTIAFTGTGFPQVGRIDTVVSGEVAIDAVSVTAVPEPATWTMMLVGFGALGGALRRRRRISLALAA